MIPVSFHQVSHLALEVAAIAEVPVFIHHDDPQPIVDIEHNWIRWVM